MILKSLIIQKAAPRTLIMPDALAVSGITGFLKQFQNNYLSEATIIRITMAQCVLLSISFTSLWLKLPRRCVSDPQGSTAATSLKPLKTLDGTIPALDLHGEQELFKHNPGIRAACRGRKVVDTRRGGGSKCFTSWLSLGYFRGPCKIFTSWLSLGYFRGPFFRSLRPDSL